MLTHLLKILWNRKKTNSLIIIEIAIAFVLLSLFSIMAIVNFNNYQAPLGFDYQNRWNVMFGDHNGAWQEQRDGLRLKQMIKVIQQLPEVKNVHILKNPAFRNWTGTSSYELNGTEIEFHRNYMDDGTPEAFNMQLLQGRWFSQKDRGQNYDPVIVNKKFVDSYFFDQDPIGQSITRTGENAESSAREKRIVGVFEDFRQLGEFSMPTPYVIYRYDPENFGTESAGEVHNIVIQVSPGTPIEFEKKLTEVLQNIAIGWDFEIKAWTVSRDQMLQRTLAPMMIFAIIGSFLIIMVAMGLFGVLWQNVISRTREIGLRRALGATAQGVHLQVISELSIICFLGIAAALVMLIQLPLLGVIQELSWGLFWQAQAVAILFMLLLSVLCAWYPGKLATDFSPAQALHYE